MKRLAPIVLAAGAMCAQTRVVHVDASRAAGAIRSFQGVNSGPTPLAPRLADVTRQYRDLGIDIVRTHDNFGPTDIDAKWPDPDPIARAVGASGANAIFPNWGADPEKEASYNFAPSDQVIRAIVASGAEVYFRVGRSWSADAAPPSDFDKFADIVRHVALHYNRGWANGLHAGIRYWEFWNEPDLERAWAPNFIRLFWSGTPPQFYELYGKVARALKSVDPVIKVGACGKARGEAAGPYREGLIAWCKTHAVPLDFYSWHHYHDRTLDPYDMVRIGAKVRELLDADGFRQAEVHCSEWNLNLQMNNRGAGVPSSIASAAFAGAALIYLQDSRVDRAFLYRGDATASGLFEYDGRYRAKAHVVKAVGAMLETPVRLAADGGDNRGFAVLAGRSKDGNLVKVLLADYRSDGDSYSLEVDHLPWGSAPYQAERYRIAEGAGAGRTTEAHTGGRFEHSGKLSAPAVELLVLRRAH